MNCLSKPNLLLNVEKAVVKCNLTDKYVCFQQNLSNYLISKYPKYYAGTQLYLDKVAPNSMTIVGMYYDICGLEDIYDDIQDDIDDFYSQYWTCSVSKTPLLRFMDNNRVIPSSINCGNCSWR